MIVLSNVNQFNYMAELWIFVPCPNRVEHPKYLCIIDTLKFVLGCLCYHLWRRSPTTTLPPFLPLHFPVSTSSPLFPLRLHPRCLPIFLSRLWVPLLLPSVWELEDQNWVAQDPKGVQTAIFHELDTSESPKTCLERPLPFSSHECVPLTSTDNKVYINFVHETSTEYIQ